MSKPTLLANPHPSCAKVKQMGRDSDRSTVLQAGGSYHFNAERLIKTSRVSPLKIKISSKNMREKPTNTPIIHSVY
jgi:hypothetical protein